MITVDTRQFMRALELASAAIPRRTNVPVLRRAKLVANGKLAIEGSDLDTFTRAELPYTGSETAFTLPDPLAVRRAIAVAGGESTQIEPQVDDMANVRTGDLSMTLREAGRERDHPGFEAVDHELFSATISAAELRHGPELARHLALWMSYEDTVRVAELKTRDTRFARVRAELGSK